MLTVDEVEELLVGSLSWADATRVEEIGAGAWSTAFAFEANGQTLVVRIGEHESDFRRDQVMSSLAMPGLPIPEVHDAGQVTTGPAEGLHYCISTRAFGVPLESCDAEEWPAIALQVAEALEAMRSCTPEVLAVSAPSVAVAPWRAQLLAIERHDDPRTAGWPAKLAASVRGADAFAAGLAHLQKLEIGDVPLTLVHGDLINRNVHVNEGSITGVFDWGCQRWGDHLFDLAWFDFWAPWHRNLDTDLLRAAVRSRWSIAGYVPEREAERTRACLIYIGLDHLIYNASIGQWRELEHVADRMADLGLI